MNLYLFTQIGFAVLTVVFFYMLTGVLFRAVNAVTWSPDTKQRFKRNWIAALLIWGAFITVWSLSGIMSNFELFPFNFMPVLLLPLVAILMFGFSRSLRELLPLIPQERIISLQIFRVFVEVLLWALFTENLLPVQMTFEGFNFDILAGATSPFIAWYVMRQPESRGLIVAWNVLCLCLLANIVTIAVLSTPTFLQVFFNEPANRIVTYFPISLLPGFLVPLAYMLHIFSIRKVVIESKAVASLAH